MGQYPGTILSAWEKEKVGSRDYFLYISWWYEGAASKHSKSLLNIVNKFCDFKQNKI